MLCILSALPLLLESTYSFNRDKIDKAFNGQKKSTEIAEDAQTALYWEYDADAGRRWNTDPVVKVWESPFSTFGSNPLINVDPNGDDWYRKDDKYYWAKGSKNIAGYERLGKSFQFVKDKTFLVTLSESKDGNTGYRVEEKGRDENEKAILKGDYVYTQNYGWLDAKHAFATTTRSNVGADNLWADVQSEKGTYEGVHNEGGYVVKYIQDAKVSFARPGVIGYFGIQPGLTMDQKREVAMSIMMTVSTEFEAFQKWAWWSNSGFQSSDLPSNVLGLYKAMFGMSRAQVENLIKPLSAAQSLNVYRENPNSLDQENRSFLPILIPNKYTHANCKVPWIFTSIKPITIDDYKKPGSTIHRLHWQPEAPKNNLFFK